MKQTGGCKVQREEEMKQLEKMFARVEAAGFGDQGSGKYVPEEE